MDFLTRTEPRYLVGWHQPLHGVDTDKVKDLALSKRRAKNHQLPLKELDCGGVCHGTMTAWCSHTFAGAAVTVEYGSGRSDHAADEDPGRGRRPGLRGRPAAVSQS